MCASLRDARKRQGWRRRVTVCRCVNVRAVRCKAASVWESRRAACVALTAGGVNATVQPSIVMEIKTVAFAGTPSAALPVVARHHHVGTAATSMVHIGYTRSGARRCGPGGGPTLKAVAGPCSP